MYTDHSSLRQTARGGCHPLIVELACTNWTMLRGLPKGVLAQGIPLLGGCADVVVGVLRQQVFHQQVIGRLIPSSIVIIPPVVIGLLCRANTGLHQHSGIRTQPLGPVLPTIASPYLYTLQGNLDEQHLREWRGALPDA